MPWFRIGWLLCAAAGLFPMVMGSFWMTKTLMGEGTDTTVLGLYQIGSANLVATGASITTLSVFGIRRGLRWCHVYVGVVLLVIGINDLLAALSFDYFPMPIFPMLLGGTGWALCFRSVWR